MARIAHCLLSALIVTALALPATAGATQEQSADTGTVASAALAFDGMSRIAGVNRFDTAARVAKASFPGWSGVKHVVVASGDDRAAVDSLPAAGLVWLYDAPLLTTSARQSPAELKQALTQIVSANTSVTVHVVGGPLSVPDARLREMASIVGSASVERLPYGDRYETARQVVVRMLAEAPSRGKTVPKTVLVARGSDPAKLIDALPLSAITARKGMPLLLVGDTMPAGTKRAIDDLQPTSAYFAGGGYPSAVTSQFRGYTYAGPIAIDILLGSSRFGTARVIAETADRYGWLDSARVVVASSMADALTGGSMFGRTNCVLLLVTPTRVPFDTAEALGGGVNNPARVYVIGGKSAVSDTTYGDVRMLVDPAVPITRRLSSIKTNMLINRTQSSQYGWQPQVTAYDQFGYALEGAEVTITTVIWTRASGRVLPTTYTTRRTTPYHGYIAPTMQYVSTRVLGDITTSNSTKFSLTYKGTTITKSTSWKF